MANKIRSAQLINDGSPVTIRYDVLDLSGVPASLGQQQAVAGGVTNV